MKLRKTGLILVLMALMIICGVLVEAEPQIFPTIPVPPPKTTPPPPPIIPTSPKTPIPPPPPPPTNSTSAPVQPPPSSTIPTQTPILTPISTPTPTPTPTPTSAPILSSPQAPTPTPPTDSCTSNDSCPDPKTMFCDLPSGKCQSKGRLSDSCNNDDECLDPFICNGNSCQYSDVGTANNNNKDYNVKKVAIIGAIVIGASAFCGLVFFVYRTFKKKRNYEITSRLYSTDDEMSEPDPYPFNERTNSFSNNTSQSPRVPPKIHFDNLLPASRGRGFAPPHQGYNNYYNEYNNEGRYNVRQNENGASRAMNRLQQTRGNVVITQPQNYNWNPSAIPPQGGGLFPIPAVNGKYGVPPVPPVPPIPNNNNMNFNNNSYNNLVDNPNHNQSSKTSPPSYPVDHSNSKHNNNHQTKSSRRDSNTLSPDNVNSGKKKGRRISGSTYSESIIDYYDRDSIFAKAIENKLPIFRRNKNPDEPVSEKKNTSRSRTQTFGHAFDPKLLQSSESEEINESKKLV